MRISLKRFRQAAILDLVARAPISSQEALRRRLRTRGLGATQATLSRDIKELGLVKRAADGAYQRPGVELARPADAESIVRRAVAEYLRQLDRVRQLLVLKTEAGQAQALALPIDRAELPGVVGTIAGDDTILVIAREARQAETLQRRLSGWAPGVRTRPKGARR